VAGDEALKTASGGRGGRGGPMFGRDLFYISILGKPSVKDPWMLQFGGHHLALNITMVGLDGILTPSLTAAQPAKYTVDGKTVRPLGAENDKAFALINAQRRAAKAGDPQLQSGRPGSGAGAGRKDNPARGHQVFRDEREPAGDAAGTGG
jgi:hypothetical protein